MKTCNRCKEDIDFGHIACPYCGGELNVAENDGETDNVKYFSLL